MSAAETLERAVTIHQPWAWAVAVGHKPVENRTWRPPLEAVGKLIGIHAGRQPIMELDAEFAAAMRATAPHVQRLTPRECTLGALIGVARLVGVVRRHPVTARMHFLFTRSDLGEAVPEDLAARIRPWWRGPWGWLLDEAVLLPEPIPMRGQQGLWRIPTKALYGPDEGPLHDRDPRAWALEQWRKARETR